MGHIVAGHHGREAYERFAVDLGCTSFGEAYESASFDFDALPVHVQVEDVRELDMARYGEAELSDRELLELAAEDAVEARRAGRIGGPVLDEVGLHRAARRAERAGIARVLRTEGAIA